MRMLMLGEVCLLSKAFTAHVARERFLSRMGAYVYIDRVLIFETFVADETMMQRPLFPNTDRASVSRTAAVGASTNPASAAINDTTIAGSTAGAATAATYIAAVATNIIITLANITRTIEFVT